MKKHKVYSNFDSPVLYPTSVSDTLLKPENSDKKPRKPRKIGKVVLYGEILTNNPLSKPNSINPEDGIVEIPGELGGGYIAIEAFDRSVTQDRAMFYLLNGDEELPYTGTYTNSNEDQITLLSESLSTSIGLNPQRVFFEIHAVLRGTEPLYQKVSTNTQEHTKAQKDFLARYDQLYNMLTAYESSRFKQDDIRDRRELRELAKTAKQIVDPLWHTVDRTPEPSSYMWPGELEEHLRRLREEREALEKMNHKQRIQQLHESAGNIQWKIILINLLNGELPKIETQRDAIAALDALAHRADYIRPGEDLPVELIKSIRNSASIILSGMSLSNAESTGRGAFRAAQEARMLRPLVRARHSSGNTPEHTPTRRKGTPTVPISKPPEE